MRPSRTSRDANARTREDATMKIEEVQSTTKKQRVATHTHIKVRSDQISRREIGHPSANYEL